MSSIQTFLSTKIIALIDATFAVAKRNPEKKSELYGILNLDLCDTGAALYELSNETTGSKSLNWFVINPLKDDDKVMNILKSYL